MCGSGDDSDIIFNCVSLWVGRSCSWQKYWSLNGGNLSVNVPPVLLPPGTE